MMLESLEQSIKKYRQINWKSLLKEDMGDYSLKEVKPVLDDIKGLFDEILSKDNLESILSQDHQNTLNSDLDQLFYTVDRINNYSDKNNRDNEIHHIQELKKQVYSHLIPIVQVLNYSYKSQSAQTPTSVKKMLKDAEKYKLSSKNIFEEYNKLLSLQQASAMPSVAKRFGNIFSEEAERNKKQAYWSLGILVISSILAIAFSFFLMIKTSTPEINTLIDVFTSNILGKIFIFSILFFIISIFRKDYISLQHQHVLNTHRQNVLSVHQEILKMVQHTKSDNDKETANTLLMELSKAMFDAKDTGYTNTRSSNSERSLAQMIRVTKNFPKTE